MLYKLFNEEEKGYLNQFNTDRNLIYKLFVQTVRTIDNLNENSTITKAQIFDYNFFYNSIDIDKGNRTETNRIEVKSNLK